MRILLFGTFDHLHPGHAFVLQEAMKRACLGEAPKGRRRGSVTVVVARDATVERIKGRPPRQSEAERKAAMEQAFPEVRVRLGDREDFLLPVREEKPDLILLGYDQKLPPGVSDADLGVPFERLPAHEPEKFKSSLQRD